MKEDKADQPSAWSPLGNPVKERFDLLPPRALARAAEIRATWAREHSDHAAQTWTTNTGPDQHINKALVHFYRWLSGDRSEDHLGHALCRAMFAVELDALAEEATAVKADDVVVSAPSPTIPPWACHCVRIVKGSWVDFQEETNCIPYWGDNKFATDKDCPDCHGDGGISKFRESRAKQAKWTDGSREHVETLVSSILDLYGDSPDMAKAVYESMNQKLYAASRGRPE